jgi:outer membrane protein
MKKVCGLICFVAVAALMASTACAENIGGKLGVTGRLGFLVPADSEATSPAPTANIDTDTAFVGGGGVIYGITKNIAAELDITHTDFDGRIGGVGVGNFETNNISIGAQYRFDEPIPHLTPYAGAGLDILVNNFTFADGVKADVDTVVGVHVAGGVDYFLMKQLALTGEMKALLAPDADIRDGGVKVGNFDPMSISMTFGVRYFFN